MTKNTMTRSQSYLSPRVGERVTGTVIKMSANSNDSVKDSYLRGCSVLARFVRLAQVSSLFLAAMIPPVLSQDSTEPNLGAMSPIREVPAKLGSPSNRFREASSFIDSMTRMMRCLKFCWGGKGG